MTILTDISPADDILPDQEQKKAALGYVQEAWAEARLDGIDDDCMAQTCLFAALMEFVSTYGEDAAATFAERLPARIREGEFSLELPRQ
jgi:predicted YcjX-like family ATPase